MFCLTLKPNRMLALTFLVLSLLADSTTAQAQYKVTNLVTTHKTGAPHHDPNLVNAWGLSFLPTSPFWVSDNGTGKTTIYDPSGNLLLTVKVPSASGTGIGSPTGQVANPSKGIFIVRKGTLKGAAAFIFATLDGTISGWNPNVDMNNAIVAFRKSGDMFTGLAIATVGSNRFLYATDAAHNKVDVFDSSFKLVSSFTDPHTPAGLAVYGIQTIHGKIYITLGIPGSKAGAVDVYNPSTKMLKRLSTNRAGGTLDEPWGLAISPSNFGHFSNALLVGNVANGHINAFNPSTGAFLGTLKNTAGKPITLSGLWALEFGGGTTANGGKNQLFFTSGPRGYTLGVFGVIKP